MSQPHKQTCPVAASLNIMGDSWTLLIVREAFNGATRFTEFQSQTGIAKNLLASRLTTMINAGLLEKQDIGTHGARHAYQLTEKGRALAPIMVALSQWGNEWVYGKGKEPVNFVDRLSDEPIAPLAPTRADGKPLAWKNVMMTVGPGANDAMRKQFEQIAQKTSPDNP
ncbi:MAG: helix-turn-helix domain-containing protein [Parasphingorhabdus sp.]|uniref:winged helix-turn-helix transcriptional regulator n=1 Tax=Parasphingorhabdus sp. TaxID=2709688 RepID=UPI0032970824